MPTESQATLSPELLWPVDLQGITPWRTPPFEVERVKAFELTCLSAFTESWRVK